jgi:hypothetical protein
LLDGRRIYRARVSASQTPPPIMNPPETRDNSRVRRAEKNNRARPASMFARACRSLRRRKKRVSAGAQRRQLADAETG